MRRAVENCRRNRGPSFVHAKVIRPYSHSLSDDEKLYKTAEEREAAFLRDLIARARAMARSAPSRTAGGAWSSAERSAS